MGGLTFDEKRAKRLEEASNMPESLTKEPHPTWRLREAAERGDVDALAMEVAKGVNLNQGGTETAFSALHKAAQRNKVEVVRELVEAGCNLNTPSALSEDSPLHVAARAGHVDVIQELISAGADYTAQNKLGWTPLHAALYSNRMDVARTLIRAGSDPTAKTKRGLTPRDVAIRASTHEVDSVLGLNLSTSNYASTTEKLGVVEFDDHAYEKSRGLMEAATRKMDEEKHQASRDADLARQDAAHVRKTEREERNLELQYTFEGTVKRNGDILEKDESKEVSKQLEKYWEKVDVPDHIPGQKPTRMRGGNDGGSAKAKPKPLRVPRTAEERLIARQEAQARAAMAEAQKIGAQDALAADSASRAANEAQFKKDLELRTKEAKEARDKLRAEEEQQFQMKIQKEKSERLAAHAEKIRKEEAIDAASRAYEEPVEPPAEAHVSERVVAVEEEAAAPAAAEEAPAAAEAPAADTAQPEPAAATGGPPPMKSEGGGPPPMKKAGGPPPMKKSGGPPPMKKD